MDGIKPGISLLVKWVNPANMKKILSLVAVLFSSVIFSQNQNISAGIAFDGEPYMVIDPNNSQHIVVAWMGYSLGLPLGIKTKVSTNGGTTWSLSPVFLPHYATTYHSADPSMDYDNTGDLWACYVDYRQAPDSGNIIIVRSTDGGFNWGAPISAMDAYDDGSKKPIDRPWMKINQVNNHIYITSKPAPWIAPPNRPYFSVSTNMGSSWLPWRYLDTTNYLVGNVIKGPMAAIDIGTSGTVHCLYPTYEPSQNPLPGFIHASSSNDGSNFAYHPAAYAIPGATDTLAKLGSNLVADPSDPNHLVFTFPFKSPGGDYDVQMIESTNGGVSWAAPVRVNDDPLGNGKMQDMIWCDFDTDGDLIVGWRDRRNGSASGYATESETWGAVKWKDSSNFSANFPIADSLVNYQPVLSQDGNDFMNILMLNDTLYAVWGEVRTGILQIWFSKSALLTGVTSVELISQEEIPSVSIFPNPSTDILKLKGDPVMSIRVFDTNGKVYLSKKMEADQQIVDISNFPSAIYFIEMKTAKGNIVSRFIKE